MKVYSAISAVQRDVAAVGIDKSRRNNQGGGYNFRGIDDVYNVLSPIMARHGLCIMPRIVSREITERASKAGGVLFYVVVVAEFDFVAAEDGSKHTVRTYGEAMDSGDKATNKAMSAAYKYAAFMTFAIPTEANEDADAHTHEVAPKPTPPVASTSAPAEVRRILDLAILLIEAPDVDTVGYGVSHIEETIAAVDDESKRARYRLALDGIAERRACEINGTPDEWKPTEAKREAVARLEALARKHKGAA